MTQEKLKRIVTAATVAGTILVACLLAVIVYQVIRMAVLHSRIRRLEGEIAQYEEVLEQNERDLSYWESEYGKEDLLRQKGFIAPGDTRLPAGN